MKSRSFRGKHESVQCMAHSKRQALTAVGSWQEISPGAHLHWYIVLPTSPEFIMAAECMSLCYCDPTELVCLLWKRQSQTISWQKVNHTHPECVCAFFRFMLFITRRCSQTEICTCISIAIQFNYSTTPYKPRWNPPNERCVEPFQVQAVNFDCKVPDKHHKQSRTFHHLSSTPPETKLTQQVLQHPTTSHHPHFAPPKAAQVQATTQRHADNPATTLNIHFQRGSEQRKPLKFMTFGKPENPPPWN